MASVNSCAAFSHCCACSYFMPCVKWSLPLFANTDTGKANMQATMASARIECHRLIDFITEPLT